MTEKRCSWCLSTPLYQQYHDEEWGRPVTDDGTLLSKALKKASSSFVGSTIMYAHMQATGMVNDHLVSCPAHQLCVDEAVAKNLL
ncbi:DNA-3-methyladenine glycosylase I [Microbulbifer sp.]|uniref:DNA-3-methyladenine glycosylase I n=1 Tax=Microbulbifer sp. TaxID=1908541 RepID=UPI003F34C4B5